MGDRDFIFELAQKIVFLAENSAAQAWCGHKNSMNSFAEKLAIPRRTLVDCIAAGKLSGTNQSRLAQRCHFRLDWPEWNDPRVEWNTATGERRDTADAFKQRYLREVQPQPKIGRLRASRPTPPEQADARLASVELNVSQQGSEEPWLVSADLICQPTPIEGMVIGVKRGALELHCDKAHIGALKDRLGYPGGITPESREGLYLRLTGTSQRPGWDVDAKSTIGVLSLPADLCRLHGVTEGEAIEMRFSVYVKDLELVESEMDAEPEQGRPANQSYSFNRPGFQQLGRAKHMILKRMAECQLPGGENGWAMLCRDGRQFDADDQMGDK
jgi:hypothetical protein